MATVFCIDCKTFYNPSYKFLVAIAALKSLIYLKNHKSLHINAVRPWKLSLGLRVLHIRCNMCTCDLPDICTYVAIPSALGLWA